MGAVYSAINIIIEGFILFNMISFIQKINLCLKLKFILAMTEPETCTSSEVYSDLEKSAHESENRKSYSDYNTDTSVSALSVSQESQEIRLFELLTLYYIDIF